MGMLFLFGGVGLVVFAALMSTWFWVGSLAVFFGALCVYTVARAVHDPRCKLSIDDIFPDFKILD